MVFVPIAEALFNSGMDYRGGGHSDSGRRRHRGREMAIAAAATKIRFMSVSRRGGVRITLSCSVKATSADASAYN